MKKVLREILSTSLYLLGVLCAVYLVIHFVGQRTQVQGSSMEPKLSTEDNLIVDKISYRFHEPERFDIIVFPFQDEKDTYFIKRIIGLPGETVQIDEKGNIFAVETVAMTEYRNIENYERYADIVLSGNIKNLGTTLKTI